jgi:hypothetical protein
MGKWMYKSTFSAALRPVPIGQEAGWTSELVWMTWRTEYFRFYRDSNSYLSVVQRVASRYIDCAIAAPLKCIINPNLCLLQIGPIWAKMIPCRHASSTQFDRNPLSCFSLGGGGNVDGWTDVISPLGIASMFKEHKKTLAGSQWTDHNYIYNVMEVKCTWTSVFWKYFKVLILFQW